MIYNAQLSPRILILNKFRIENIWHVQWIKPCQLPGWMKNSPYHGATAYVAKEAVYMYILTQTFTHTQTHTHAHTHARTYTHIHYPQKKCFSFNKQQLLLKIIFVYRKHEISQVNPLLKTALDEISSHFEMNDFMSLMPYLFHKSNS